MPSSIPGAIRWKSPSSRPKEVGDEMVAVLRRTADADSEQLTVRYGDADVRLELKGPLGTVLDGVWHGAASCQKKPLVAEDNWDEICWHSDRDVDYLEIQQTLAGGWSRQRQFLLARSHRFLFLAEAVLGPPAAYLGKPRIDYSCSWQLGGGTIYHGAAESYEGLIRRGKKTVALVVPPGLPEWRADHFPGKLEGAEDRLTLSTAVEGANLYAPLFIDLEPTRFKQLVTWRRLTVGENLEIVSKDVAVGYRVQVGTAQWLFYRALKAKGNRTVMGYNTSHEFGCQRFLPDGTIGSVVEIE